MTSWVPKSGYNRCHLAVREGDRGLPLPGFCQFNVFMRKGRAFGTARIFPQFVLGPWLIEDLRNPLRCNQIL